MLQQRILDNRGLAYLKEYLTLWRMAGLLLSKLNLEEGKIWTYLSPEITDDVAYNFSSGGINPPSTVKIPLGNGFFATPVNNLSKSIVSTLAEEFIKSHPNGICLIDDRLHGKEEFEADIIHDERLTYPVLFYENEAYFYLTNRNLDNLDIKDFFLDRHSGFHALTALIALPINTELLFTTLREAVSLETLEMLIGYTQIIIINAYDWEGYLIWSRA